MTSAPGPWRAILRPDLLEPLVGPLEQAITAALAGRPYQSGMASVRRPLHRMVDDLAAFRP